MAECEQFEAAISTKPEAGYWSTTDAMYWTWHAARAAQPAQAGAEPVEQLPIAMKTHGAWDGLELLDGLPDGACLYTHPPARVPLTDEQWQVIADTLNCFVTRSQKDTIEAALGIKD